MKEYWIIEQKCPLKYSEWEREWGHKVYESWQVAAHACEQKGGWRTEHGIMQYRLRKLIPSETVIVLNTDNYKHHKQ